MVALSITSLVVIVTEDRNGDLLAMASSILGVSSGLLLVGCLPLFIVGGYLVQTERKQAEDKEETTASSSGAYVLIRANDEDNTSDDE